jgi:putative transposase
MSSHVHMIMGRNGEPTLQDIIRDIKKFTSNKIIEAIRDNPQESRRELFMWLFERAGKRNPNNTKYQFWMQHNQPIALVNERFLPKKLDYIHMNPVAAGLVQEPEDWLYSSAVNYSGRPGKKLDVILI